MNHDPTIAREFADLLTYLQNLSREYVTQGPQQRKMTFASMRTAAETIATLADDFYNADRATDIRKQVHQITQQLDELLNRFGSDAPGECRACGHVLAEARLGFGGSLKYCTHCPTPILEAVRDISDLTGAEVL